MKKITLKQWDSAEHLKTDEDIALYFDACLQEAGDDVGFITKALGNIARAKGMSKLARDTRLGRESLYKALSEQGNPSLATILKVTNALGIQFHASAKVMK
jgi:probable addiction module antidote protein